MRIPLKLQAQLIAHVDDSVTYAVVADELQEANNPLGEYLTDAVNGEHTLKKQRARFFPWLPKLKDSKLTWSLGFLESIVITSRTGEQAASELKQLLECPLSFLVQRIRIVEYKEQRGEPFDFSNVIAVLAKSELPALRELRMGDGGAFPIPQSLRDKFPLNDADSWEVVCERVKKARGRLRHRFDTTKLQPLQRVDPKAAPETDYDLIIVGLRRELESAPKKKKSKKKSPPKTEAPELGLLRALRAHFTRASLDAFVTNLARQWVDADTPTTMRVAFDALPSLGGDQAAEFLGTYRGDGARANHALEALQAIGTPLAGLTLYRRGYPDFRPGIVAARARKLFASMANATGTTSEGLVDQLCAKLADRHRGLLAQISRARFERLMIDGHRMSLDTLQHCYLQAPLPREELQSVVGLILGFYVDDKLSTTATLRDGDGLMRADGSPLSVDEGTTVGVVHPVEMSTDELNAWKKVVDGPAWQIARPFARVGKLERTRQTLRRELLARHDQLWHMLRDGWTEGSVDLDDNIGNVLTWTREFPRDRCTITIDLRRMRAHKTIDVYRRRGSFAKLHPVTQSEVLAAISPFSRPIKSGTPDKPKRAKGATTKKGTVTESPPDESAAPEFQKGDIVRVTKGKARDKSGPVFWSGPSKWGKGLRYGLKIAGETVWVGQDEIERA